jgi:hypothetical protein
MRLQILPSAVADLLDGAHFYELKEEGLGRYFFESVSADIDSLQTKAGVHRKQFGFHRLICKRFPHAVYYSISS